MNLRILVAHTNRRTHLQLQRILRSHVPETRGSNDRKPHGNAQVCLDSVFDRESVFDMVWRWERLGRPYNWLFIEGRLLSPEAVQRWAEDLALLSPSVSVVLIGAPRCRHTDTVWAVAHHPSIHARVAEPLTPQRVLQLCGMHAAATHGAPVHPEVERVVEAVRALESSYQPLYAEIAGEGPADPRSVGSAASPMAQSPGIDRDLLEAVESLGQHLERCQPLVARMHQDDAAPSALSTSPARGGPTSERTTLWQRLKQALLPTTRKASLHAIDIDVGPSGTRFTMRVPESEPLNRTGQLPHQTEATTGESRSRAHADLMHQLLSKSNGRLSLVARPDSAVPDVSIHIPHPSPCPNRAGE